MKRFLLSLVTRWLPWQLRPHNHKRESLQKLRISLKFCTALFPSCVQGYFCGGLFNLLFFPLAIYDQKVIHCHNLIMSINNANQNRLWTALEPIKNRTTAT